jgi:hypothetical protein
VKFCPKKRQNANPTKTSTYKAIHNTATSGGGEGTEKILEVEFCFVACKAVSNPTGKYWTIFPIIP